MIARGAQKNGYGARHNNGVQIAFVAVAVHHHHIAGRHGVVPDDFVAGGGAVGDEKAVVGVEDARGVALALADGAVVVKQLPQLLHGVAHVGAQHVFAIELVVHLPDGAFQEGDAARVPGAVPGVGAVFGVVQQRAEKGRLDAFQIRLGFAEDMARDEVGRVLKHVDEAVQLAQHVVGHMLAGFGFAVQVDGHVGVLAAHFLYEVAQVQHGGREVGAGAELLIINGEDEGAGAALLLRELRQVAVAGGADHLKALILNGLRQGADAQAGAVFGVVVFINDDDGKAEFHGVRLWQKTPARAARRREV